MITPRQGYLGEFLFPLHLRLLDPVLLEEGLRGEALEEAQHLVESLEFILGQPFRGRRHFAVDSLIEIRLCE